MEPADQHFVALILTRNANCAKAEVFRHAWARLSDGAQNFGLGAAILPLRVCTQVHEASFRPIHICLISSVIALDQSSRMHSVRWNCCIAFFTIKATQIHLTIAVSRPNERRMMPHVHSSSHASPRRIGGRVAWSDCTCGMRDIVQT